MDLVIAVADPRVEDVRGLLEAHLAFCREVTPPGHVHAFDVDDFLDPAVTLFGGRRDGVLVGVGALKRLDGQHAELKSMHTGEFSRGQGVGQAMLRHVLAYAVDHGFRDVSLETGTIEAFAPARTLYAKAGFVPCGPFGPYTDNPNSACMTIALGSSAIASATDPAALGESRVSASPNRWGRSASRRRPVRRAHGVSADSTTKRGEYRHDRAPRPRPGHSAGLPPGLDEP